MTRPCAHRRVVVTGVDDWFRCVDVCGQLLHRRELW